MAPRKRTSVSRKRAVSGAGLISSIVNKAVDLLPFEAHLPGYNYCGPGTKLQKRLARGDKGVNPLDEACKTHDIAYSKYKDSDNRRRADEELAERAWRRFKAPDASFGEKAAAWAVTTAMKAKTKFGGGNRKKKRTTKRKTQTKGKGLYLRPYPKQGAGKKKSKITKKTSIPIKALTNYDLLYYAKELRIPHFRGVFMRDMLPDKPKNNESGIVNLDSGFGDGTHWVCYKKKGSDVYYFDSFGNLKPPRELLRYFKDCNVYYNYERQQSFDSVVCGHLCLKFLSHV